MNKTVLVIDDSKTIQKAFEFTFRRTAFKYEKAMSGNEGFEKAKQIKPDLILLDFSLPDVDAIELCKKFKSDPELKAIPIIICAGMSRNITEEDAKAAGAYDLLRKPFETQAVLDLAEQAVQEAPAGAEILEDLQIEELEEIEEVQPEQVAQQVVQQPVAEQPAQMEDIPVLEPVEAASSQEPQILTPVEEEQVAEENIDILEPLEEPVEQAQEELPTLEPISEEEEIEKLETVEPVEESISGELVDFPEAGADLEPLEEEPQEQMSVEITEEPIQQPETSAKTLEMFGVKEEETFSLQDLPSEEAGTAEKEVQEEISIEEPIVEDYGVEEEKPPIIEEIKEEEQPEVETPIVEEEVEIETQSVDLTQEQLQEEVITEEESVSAESIEIAEPEVVQEPVIETPLPEEPEQEAVEAYVSRFEEEVVLAAPPDEKQLLEEAKKQKEKFVPAPSAVSINEEQITEIVVKALKKLAAEKLEAIAWEVVPELAEVIIKRELERITAEKG